MELTVLHLFPDFMSLYGEYANVAVLRRHLESVCVKVTARTVTCEDGPDFQGADLIYMGAGTERKQKIALEKLLPHAEELKAAVERGAAVLFTGNAMETLGASITDASGKVWPGLGLAGFTTVETDRRSPGDVVAAPALWDSPAVGFMNKCSATVHGAASGLRQRGGTRPGGLRLRQCIRHPSHRPGAGEKPAIHGFPDRAAVRAEGLGTAGDHAGFSS